MILARRTMLSTGLALAAARPAFAIDTGTASGRYEGDEGKITVSHAIALSLENVEGVLDHKREMRVLLSDREVPPSALMGLMFPPVWAMARAGALKGLLLEFDPSDRSGLHVVALTKRDDGYSPASISLSNSNGLWSKLDVSATRVSGEFKAESSETLAFKFSAPVFNDAVVQDLKGPAAAASEPVKVLLARAEAMARGDIAAAAALSTETSMAGIQALPPEVLAASRKEVGALTRQLRATKRVVIREQTAAVSVGDGSWSSVARVGGVWKAAD